MKKAIPILLALIFCTILAACSKQLEPALPSSTPTGSQQTNDTVSSKTSNSKSLFKTEYIPVASSQGYFIICNESRNLYGLVDNAGRFVLPCEYGKISFSEAKSQTVLKVESRGSYGVYDLSGRMLIPCEYTEIYLSPYSDSCIVKTFVNKYGVFDFNGKTILPIEYDVLRFGYGKIYAAAKNADGQTPSTVAAYDLEGKVVKEFAWDKGTVRDIVVGSGGNLLSVNFSSGNGIDVEYLPIVGPATWGDTVSLGNHLLYFLGDELVAKNMVTQEEVDIWKFPDSQNWNNFLIGGGYQTEIDPISKTEYVDLLVSKRVLGKRDLDACSLRVTFSDPISVIDYDAIGLEKSYTLGGLFHSGDELGAFYDGLAMVLPSEGYTYVVNSDGSKVYDITAPYTLRQDCFLLGNAAVLNNNGFYSIVGMNGEILLSKTGYSKVQKLNVPGLYAVTDQNGMLGLINEYAEELVPCGGVESIQTSIFRPDTDDWDLESSHYTRDELYTIHNGGKWAVYSSKKHQLVTGFMELDGDGAIQHDCVLGKGGYALIDEERDNAYLISYENGSYQVSTLASLA